MPEPESDLIRVGALAQAASNQRLNFGKSWELALYPD